MSALATQRHEKSQLSELAFFHMSYRIKLGEFLVSA